ncbi:cysteine--tRNA ligase [bacterium]|nr:cysteine--tRNA ligase [bacterium]
MALRIYNTMTQQKEEFSPLEPGRVRIYVCGVTVYDRCHVGHARSQVVFDTVVRYLRHKGFQVDYARNFTDVDDKIINRANEQGRPWHELVADNIDAFYADMDPLGIARPTFEPRATDHIPQMIALIEKLVAARLAYPLEGDVYYSARKFPGYGKLSKKNLDDLIAGERVDVDERKQHPADFALWKASKPGEPSWPSPWGPGRPGWHIECSAMSAHLLGQPFDIHGGGRDLMFPHHENEIAQTEGATGQALAKVWMHNGFVQFNHEKMAKSTGNFFTIRTVLDNYAAETLRYFLLSAHYRSPLDYSEQIVLEAQAGVDRLYAAYDALVREAGDASLDEGALNARQTELLGEVREARAAFFVAMDDDFNTAKATGHMFEIARAVNAVTSDANAGAAPGRAMLMTELGRVFREMNDVLGICLSAPADYFTARSGRALKKRNLSADGIEAKIKARADARAARDFARADAIRDELAEAGIIIKDSPSGTTWTVK